MVLPREYKQVKYIQSSATNPWSSTSSSWQCIDTWFIHTPNTKVEIDFQYLVTTVQQRMFGTETTSSSYSTFVTYINWSTQWARATKDWEWNWQSTSVSADTNRHTFVLDKSTYTIYTNWSQIHSWSNAYTITKNWQYPLTLFASWYSSYIEHSSGRLYWCKIWDNDILQRDFVPVIRVSDSKPWLYDLVNDVFYTNAGTWEFTYEKYAEKGKFSKILLWESQIYPPVPKLIEYNYNFTDWTWTNAKLIADWWGAIWKQENTPWWSTSYWMTMMSGILWCYNTSTDKGCSTWKRIEIPNWVTHLSLKAKWEKEGSWWGVNINIYDPVGNKTIIWMWASYNTGKNWYHINWTDVKTWSNSYVIIWEWEVDCSTWAWSCTINNWWSASWTISSFTPPSEAYISLWISKWYYSTPTGIYYIELKMR